MAAKKNLPPFTPVFDSVVQDVGTIGALVYGVVWRHCQMRNGVCVASKDTMAELTGLTRRSIQMHLARLVERGYILDFTPTLTHKPHTYMVANIELGANDVHTLGVNDIPEGANVIPLGVNNVPLGVNDVHIRIQEDTKGYKKDSTPAASSSLEELTSWYIANSEGEVDSDIASEAVKLWLATIQDSGKNWKPKNLAAITERYKQVEGARQKEDAFFKMYQYGGS